MHGEDVLSAAEAYITRHGDILQRARAAALLHGTRPTPEALAQWGRGRQPDGGWASDGVADGPAGTTRGRSRFIATVRALRTARELDLGIVPEVRLALLWLTRQQRPDGSFVDEYPAVSDALDALRLGVPDERMTVWATATGLHFLDEWMGGIQAFSYARQQAYDWLTGRVDDWGRQHSRTIWLAAGCALRRGAESPLTLKRLAVLALRLGESAVALSARDLADVVVTLTEAGMSASRSPVSYAMTLLGQTRREDGAFADPLGREDAVESTLAAVRAYLATGTPVAR